MAAPAAKAASRAFDGAASSEPRQAERDDDDGVFARNRGAREESGAGRGGGCSTAGQQREAQEEERRDECVREERARVDLERRREEEPEEPEGEEGSGRRSSDEDGESDPNDESDRENARAVEDEPVLERGGHRQEEPQQAISRDRRHRKARRLVGVAAASMDGDVRVRSQVADLGPDLRRAALGERAEELVVAPLVRVGRARIDADEVHAGENEARQDLEAGAADARQIGRCARVRSHGCCAEATPVAVESGP